MRSNAVDVVIIDSVAALVPRAELEGEMGDSFVGLHARLMSQGMRKLTGAISKSNCLVDLHQPDQREGGGSCSAARRRPPAVARSSSTPRCASDIRRIGQLKDGDNVVGNRTKVTVVKNKIAPPFRKVEFDILYNRGISKQGELIDLGLKAGVVLKSGTWYSMKHPKDGEIRLGQGMERTRNFLIDNPDLAQVVEDAIRAKYAPKDGSEGEALPQPAAKVFGKKAAIGGGRK